MKSYINKLFCFTCFIFLLPTVLTPAVAAPLIIDHNSVSQFDRLTDAQLTAASSLTFGLQHASVGNRIGARTDLTGTDPLSVSGLERIKLLYCTPEQLAGNTCRYNRNNWNFHSIGNPPWYSKFDRFYTPPTGTTGLGTGFVVTNLNSYSVMGMKLCYREPYAYFDLDNNGSYETLAWDFSETYNPTLRKNISTPAHRYITMMEAAEAKFGPGTSYNKTFIWITHPIHFITNNDPPADQWQRMKYNQAVREYVIATEKVLFDIADIEAYHYYDTATLTRATPVPVTPYPATYSVTGDNTVYVNYPRPETDINSNLDSNFYNSDGGHPYNTGRVILAKAFWVLMSGVASIRNGTVPTASPSPTPPAVVKTGDANGDTRVDGLDYVIWLNHYGGISTGATSGDFNADNRVDGLDYVIWLNNYGR